VNYHSSEDEATDVVRSIVDAGGEARKVRADVTAPLDVARLFDETEAVGPLRIVVHAAGATIFTPLAEAELEDFERQTSLNAKGSFLVLREAASRIVDGGRIVHIATNGTQEPIAGGGLYIGSKAQGELMALCLAKELGPRQVNVNVVSPGVTDTDGMVLDDDQAEEMVARTPLGRLGQPEDIARVIAFLCGADAHWISGQTINANGGLL
jgi:3-oxoacyl-[acyl-carrier protein] reductase